MAMPSGMCCPEAAYHAVQDAVGRTGSEELLREPTGENALAWKKVGL
jgi:hypothetical protein